MLSKHTVLQKIIQKTALLTLTLLKSSAVALISFQVLFNSWMQMANSSSNARSWVKNMG